MGIVRGFCGVFWRFMSFFLMVNWVLMMFGEIEWTLNGVSWGLLVMSWGYGVLFSCKWIQTEGFCCATIGGPCFVRKHTKTNLDTLQGGLVPQFTLVNPRQSPVVIPPLV